MNAAQIRSLMNELTLLAGYRGYALSAPVPSLREGQKTDCAFLYPTARQTMRSRPIASMELSAASGLLLQFAHICVDDFADAPRDAQADYSIEGGISAAEQLARVRMLDELYEAARAAAFEENPTAEEVNAVQAYVQQLQKTVPAGLMPYYEALLQPLARWLSAHE